MTLCMKLHDTAWHDGAWCPAAHLLVVEPLQEAAHHPLEGPAPLRLAEAVKLALLDAAETPGVVFRLNNYIYY